MYIGDGNEQEIITVKGNEESMASGMEYEYMGGYDPHFNVDKLAANESDLLFSSEDGYGRVFSKDDEGYRAISSSILLGALASGDSLNLKAFLLAEIVNGFLGYNPSTSLQESFSALLNGSNYPNPFNSETTIQYTLSEAGRITIEIYNLNGKVIKKLVNDDLLPGSYSVTWDATGENGNPVDDGFYFFKVRQGNNSVTAKMVLLH